MKHPADELRSLDQAGLLRQLTASTPHETSIVERNGQRLWNFASNDYLGLTTHPPLRQAFIEGIERFGHGAGSSRLITGSQPPHLQFEETLAAAKQTEAALLFSSGFACAFGSIPAIVGKDDFVVLDKLCHACLVDGARLSGATLRVFPHNDVSKLEKLLTRIRAKRPDARILIVTESVFSMDGDLCPLNEILRLKETHDALLMLDEAHGFGVLGSHGMGLAEALGAQARIDFQMGTLSKAAGLSGAYLACSRDWRDLLVNRARSFVFSTAPPPALAFAATAALSWIRSPEGDRLRRQLQSRIDLVRPGPTPILPFILGENESAMQASETLAQQGFFVPPIRFPTVPRRTARLRVSLSAVHPVDAVRQLAAILADLP